MWNLLKKNVYRETYFSQKMFKNRINATVSQSQKDSPRSGSTLSGKEKVPGTAVSKEGIVLV